MKVLILLPFFLVSLQAYSQSLDGYPITYGKYVDLDDYYLSFDKMDGPNRPSGLPFTGVVLKYGKAEVELGDFNVDADQKPWSSWWYPRFDKLLFFDKDRLHPSTLTKYDKFASEEFNENKKARNFEEKNLYNERAVSWEGMCGAWAIAALMEKEPVRPVTKDRIKFNIVDLKGLLLKTYEDTPLTEMYGQRNNATWDSVYEDIYPEQLHRFLQVEIFGKKNAFIMDYDAGYQVWNVPVYKAKMKITKDDQNSNVVHVKLYLSYPSQFIDDYNFVGTKEILKSYTYDLYGNWNRNKKFVVEYGLWTNESRWDHPDYVIAKPTQVVRKSQNTEIDPIIVDKILEGSR
jgi:hypothetical protein